MTAEGREVFRAVAEPIYMMATEYECGGFAHALYRLSTWRQSGDLVAFEFEIRREDVVIPWRFKESDRKKTLAEHGPTIRFYGIGHKANETAIKAFFRDVAADRKIDLTRDDTHLSTITWCPPDPTIGWLSLATCYPPREADSDSIDERPAFLAFVDEAAWQRARKVFAI